MIVIQPRQCRRAKRFLTDSYHFTSSICVISHCDVSSGGVFSYISKDMSGHNDLSLSLYDPPSVHHMVSVVVLLPGEAAGTVYSEELSTSRMYPAKIQKPNRSTVS